LKRTNRKYVRRILGLLLKHGRESRSGEFLELLGIPSKNKSSLSNNLDVLERFNFIARAKRGPIRLKFKTPLCFVANTPNVPYAYLGLLGVKDKREISETETAVKILGSLGLRFERIVVITTPEAVGSWSGAISPELRIEWHTLSKDELNKIEKVEERVKPKLAELMEKYVLIMDCTSGTRPAGIAYYKLATRYKIPLIHVYEPEKELVWLISKEDLEKELKHLFVCP
jgi:hypothetical protein